MLESLSALKASSNLILDLGASLEWGGFFVTYKRWG